MKRKERDGEAPHDAEEATSAKKDSEPEAGQAKRLKEGGAAAAQQLHESVLRELSRLDAQKNALSAGASSSASTEEATTSSSSSSSASSSSSVQLAPAFLELNSFALPSDLFESEAWDLREVELRNWWAPSTRGGRPAVEIGSAKRRSSDTYVYLALPTDTANPSHPVVFIKQKDGRDGPIGADDEGIPLADFLAALRLPCDEGEEEEDEEDEEDAGDEDPYSGFISAIVAGEELPSEDEDDDDHDADQDDEEDGDFDVDEDDGQDD